MGIGKEREEGGGRHLPTVLTAPTIPLNHPFFFGVSVAEPAATASCRQKSNAINTANIAIATHFLIAAADRLLLENVSQGLIHLLKQAEEC